MRESDLKLRLAIAAAVIVSACTMSGCSSDPPPPPELNAQLIFKLIGEKWSQEELNHFRVTFHSDTLVECGVKNNLWKLTEMTDRAGTAWSAAYQLTDKGKAILSAIDLKESGRGHEITLKGPYHVELTGIQDGSQPNTKIVGFRWSIDWDKASPDMKACVPQFELTGQQVALFELHGQDWTLVSYLRPEDVPAAPAGSALDKLR